MQITRAEPFILHVPVTGSRTNDSTPARLPRAGARPGAKACERFRQPAA